VASPRARTDARDHGQRRADLVDEFLLFIYPVVLGSGELLFPERVGSRLQLVSGKVTAAGTIIASYETVSEQPE
jgi:dihydrofolate reductase